MRRSPSAADVVEAITARLAERAGPGGCPGCNPTRPAPAQEFFPTSPIIGMINPIAPPVLVRVVDGADGGYREIEAVVNFDYPYEGPPTCVHGGVIAETFDEVLGAANMVAGNPAMTGTLTVRYRKPTPLHTDLRVVARCTGRDGRKILAWAGMYNGDLHDRRGRGDLHRSRPAAGSWPSPKTTPRALDPATLEVMRAEASGPKGRPPTSGSVGGPPATRATPTGAE